MHNEGFSSNNSKIFRNPLRECVFVFLSGGECSFLAFGAGGTGLEIALNKMFFLVEGARG